MHQLVYEKEKLQLLRNQNLQAEIIRSKAQIYERNDKNFLNYWNIQALNQNSKNICKGPISEYEVKTVLKDMKNQKSPGTDGFPAEFCNFFAWHWGIFSK